MKNFLKCSLIPAAINLLSACNTVIVKSYSSIPANYNEGYFGLAATKGTIVTIVAGNPFSTQSWNFGAANFGAGNFEDRVRALMKDRVRHFPVSFHGANTTKPYRVVVVFNPHPIVDNRTIFLLEKQTPMTANSTGVGRHSFL